MPDVVALMELLTLEALDIDLFRGRQPKTERQRVFGGQVAGQAVMAATGSVEPGFAMHSLHSYFLRPGDTSVPIIYEVQRIRDGRSFLTRRVEARQHGRPIYYMTANFQRPEDGLEHQDVMPTVAGPESGVSMADLAAKASPESALEWEREWSTLDVRMLGNSARGLRPDPDHPARAHVWIRINGRLSDDPAVQQAAFTYASDMTLLATSLVPHGLRIISPEMQSASLDHTVWFHRPFRADEWWFYDQVSPIAIGGRGLVTARVWSQSGDLVATVAQEGLIRPRITTTSL